MRNIFGAVVCFVLAAVCALAQTAAPAMDLSNDKLTLTVAAMGGKFTKLVMREGDGTNPIHTIGHFLALDGFGAASDEEQALGMPFHGEANRREMKVVASNTSGPVRVLTLQSTLPLAQETLTRTMQLVDGENIVYVTSQLESALTIDRPISWAEHATIGQPFLAKGKTVVDMPGVNCRVRPYKPGPSPDTLCTTRTSSGPWLRPLTEGRPISARSPPITTGSISPVARWTRGGGWPL